MNNQIPPHKSERMFRRYETAIFAITQHFPKPLSFDPKPLSIVTFTCRLRDAMASVLEYHWSSPIDLNRLAEIRPQIEVVQVSGMVVVRRVGDEKPALHNAQGEPAIQDDFAFRIDSEDPVAILAAAYLIDRKFLTRPVEVLNNPRSSLDKAMEQYDVGFTETPNGSFVLL